MSRGWPNGIGAVRAATRAQTLQSSASRVGAALSRLRIPPPPSGSVGGAAIALGVGIALKYLYNKNSLAPTQVYERGKSGVNPAWEYWGIRYDQYFDGPEWPNWTSREPDNRILGQNFAGPNAPGASWPDTPPPLPGQWWYPQYKVVTNSEDLPPDWNNRYENAPIDHGWFGHIIGINRVRQTNVPYLNYEYYSAIAIWIIPPDTGGKVMVESPPKVNRGIFPGVMPYADAVPRTGVVKDGHYIPPFPVPKAHPIRGVGYNVSDGTVISPDHADQQHDVFPWIFAPGVRTPPEQIPVGVPGSVSPPKFYSRGIGINQEGSLVAAMSPAQTEVKTAATKATMLLISQSIGRVGEGIDAMRCVQHALGNTYKRGGKEKTIPKWRWAEALKTLATSDKAAKTHMGKRTATIRKGDGFLTADGREISNLEFSQRLVHCLALNHVQDMEQGLRSKATAAAGGHLGLTAGPLGVESLVGIVNGDIPYEQMFSLGI